MFNLWNGFYYIFIFSNEKQFKTEQHNQAALSGDIKSIGVCIGIQYQPLNLHAYAMLTSTWAKKLTLK